MSDFEYTDSLEDIDSSAVVDAYYNINDKSMLVVLASNEDAYIYTGVPSYVWSQFKAASSKGSYYATQIKRNYGPAKALGNSWLLDIAEYGGVPAPSMASVTPIAPYVTLGNPPSSATGTPKGLTYASDAKVSTSVPVFGESEGVRKATTSVLIEGTNGEHTVNFDDKSTVDEALAAIDELSSKLGVSVKVKAVTVHFE